MPDTDLLTIQEASVLASQYTHKQISTSNIAYLLQYGRVKKIGHKGTTQVSKSELLSYYQSIQQYKSTAWQNKLGADLNWALSFDQYKEAETTKHVHRLHPYKGKFIPQLVEYFLDSHTDAFKTTSYFKVGDIILDPFAGSGTTMVQASELHMHCIGIDISTFNSLIGNAKVYHYDIQKVSTEIDRINKVLQTSLAHSSVQEFEEELLKELSGFNKTYFPVPEYKYRVRAGEIDEDNYGLEKQQAFLKVYNNLLRKYHVRLIENKHNTFIEQWFYQPIRTEIQSIFSEINKITDNKTRDILCLILSRTMRSCRATTHADLATLLKPIDSPYYCAKHGKICKPVFSILKWWFTYCKDTLKRIAQFSALRSDSYQVCLTGDSRKLDIISELALKNKAFSQQVATQKIKGIFSSPPYVGLIDYHQQHAYAYDLLGFERQDKLEIGPLFQGQGGKAKQNYVQDISAVLNHCQQYLVADYNVFLVANDKFNLYPSIAENANMKIVNRFRRPVLNRTEKDKGAYSEMIFHLKAN